MMAVYCGGWGSAHDWLRGTSGNQRCRDGTEFGQLRRSSPGKRGASLLSCMVARKSICLRRAAAGQRSQSGRFGRTLDNRKGTVDGLSEGWGGRTSTQQRGRRVLANHETGESKFRTSPG